MDNKLTASKHYKFLTKEFSDLWITRFRQLHDSAEKNKIYNEYHLKWILNPDCLKHHVEEFPWIKTIPLFDYTKESLVFFRLNGKTDEDNHFDVHKDPYDARANLNIPVYNCTKETKTTWVEPIGDEVAQYEERMGSKIVAGQTYSNHLKSPYREIDSCSIVDRCVLFRGDVWHRVDVNYTEDKIRVMAKVWNRGIGMDELIDIYKDYIDENYDWRTADDSVPAT